MIKKVLLSLWLFWLSLISFSYASNFTTYYYNDWYNQRIHRLELDYNSYNEFWDNSDILHWTEWWTVNNYYLNYNWNWNWFIDDDSIYDNIFKLTNTNWYWTWSFWLWDIDNRLWFSSNQNYPIITPLKVLKSTSWDFANVVYNSNNYTYDISDFYNLTWNIDSVLFWVNVSNSEYNFISVWSMRYLCFKFDNLDVYCVWCTQNWWLWYGDNYTPFCYWWQEISHSLNFYNNYSDYESILWESPFNWGGGWFNWTVELDNSDIVWYYESTRGFNYNMCFVWTWDFTDNSWTFKQWNWEHIFSYFNWFYNLWTWDNATWYNLSDVWKFIDEMYWNYDIYFNYWNRYWNWDIAYIYKFDINTHTLDWVDTWFNNPFDVNTYVYTFYPKTLHYYTDYWRLYYYWGDLANYCYYKLNLNNSPQEDIYWDLENDISQEDLNNIWNWKIISSDINLIQSWNVISSSEDWHNSPLDYFAVENGSWYENFDVWTFFSSSFNRFKWVFGELNSSDFGFGYLPWYIIAFMLAFILFRFLSH